MRGMMLRGLVAIGLVALLTPAPAAAQIDTSTDSGKIAKTRFVHETSFERSLVPNGILAC